MGSDSEVSRLRTLSSKVPRRRLDALVADASQEFQEAFGRLTFEISAFRCGLSW